jgi:hypothetical protein
MVVVCISSPAYFQHAASLTILQLQWRRPLMFHSLGLVAQRTLKDDVILRCLSFHTTHLTEEGEMADAFLLHEVKCYVCDDPRH